VVFPSAKGLLVEEKPFCFPAQTVTSQFLRFLRGMISG
jgi:hypothetical protein